LIHTTSVGVGAPTTRSNKSIPLCRDQRPTVRSNDLHRKVGVYKRRGRFRLLLFIFHFFNTNNPKIRVSGGKSAQIKAKKTKKSIFLSTLCTPFFGVKSIIPNKKKRMVGKFMDRERITDGIKKGYKGVKSFFKESIEVFKNPALLDEKDASASARQKWRQVGYFIFMAFGGFIFTLAESYGGGRIFSCALLCAGTGRAAAYIFTGVLAGSLCLGRDAFPSLLIAAVIFVCRALTNYKSERVTPGGELRFNESLLFRVALSSAGAFIFGVYRVVMGGFSFAAVGALIFSVTVCPLICYMLACVQGREAPSEAFREAGVFTLVFCIVFVFSSVKLLGFRFAHIAAFLLTVYSAACGGLLRALCVGLVCGLALDLSYVPIFAFCGLCAGALRCFGCSVASSGALAGSIFAYLYVRGALGILDFSGNLLFAELLYLPFATRNMLPKLGLFEPRELGKGDQSVADGIRKQSEEGRILALSAAFDELSTMFLKLSERLRKPGAYELSGMCERVCSRYCRQCTLAAVCWQKEFESTNDAINRMVGKLKDGGAVERADLPEYFRSRCRHLDKLIADLNKSMAEMVEEAARNDKTELFALDYEAMADILSQAVSDGDGESEYDPQLQAKVARLLSGIGVNALGYGVWGRRKKVIVASGIEIAELNISAADIRSALEEATGLHLGSPRFDFDGDYVTMTVESEGQIELECWYSSTCAENEKVSGDTVKCFGEGANRRYALICDGMGSGREAALVSRISGVFLEKMLSAGNKKEIALKMLSNFIRAKNSEHHSTVDLCEIDLYDGEATFVKSGAAPSYVLRGENIYKIDAKSMPIGITREINASSVGMKLLAGDVVVMTSDGVSSGADGSFWLPELILSCGALSVKELCLEIQRGALEHEQKRDDVSICVMRVKAREAH